MKVTSVGRVWFLSVIYGNPNPKFRAQVWDRGTRFGASQKEAWCMIADFKEILSNEEKTGGKVRHPLNLSNLSAELCFANPAWFNMFPSGYQWFLERFPSDHRPVLVKFMGDQEPFRGQFHFDKRWPLDPNFVTVIKNAWDSGCSNNSGSSLTRIVNFRRAISAWKRQVAPNSQVRIKRLREELRRKKKSDIRGSEE
ncbi:unnamed protein product [Microthlaspi erraticum]|uniref:Endonuclease/exonuclease/phosphatase domain-containing protein n=1 Tax=Microthlaspi erraticum TaxID=1685480 RepID=A0A6D2JEC6_9BRAS|nr:unnamed protein product [Microthlaspi erraticum]CAA7036229.1 unnamed protein product [Microthlaspi erraticum]